MVEGGSSLVVRQSLWKNENKHRLFIKNNNEYNTLISKQIGNIIQDGVIFQNGISNTILYFKKNFLISHITNITREQPYILSLNYHDKSIEINSHGYSEYCNKLETIAAAIPEDDPERDGKLLYLELLKEGV